MVIGYDRRFLSKEAVIWACQILGKEGIHVQFVNRSAPTPLLMFYVMKHELDYGMMVTASHNPAIYNASRCLHMAEGMQTSFRQRTLKMASGSGKTVYTMP